MNGVALGCLGISFINWVILYATPNNAPCTPGCSTRCRQWACSPPRWTWRGGVGRAPVGYEAAFVAALLSLGGALAVFLHQGETLRAV